MAAEAQTQNNENSWIPIPPFIRSIYSRFPLYYHPVISSPTPLIQASSPVLWIHPPVESISKVLSRDVECLKWQAYIALRGINGVRVRWDIDPAGGVDGRLPTLWLPPQAGEADWTKARGQVLGVRMVPGWADNMQGVHGWSSELEGYIDSQARDESRAWVALMEGVVHAALLSYEPAPSLFATWLYSKTSPVTQMTTLLNPPPAPFTGYSTLIAPQGVHIPIGQLRQRYQEAIASLSERLGTDKWFLGSPEPTPLDALIFSYLHIALHPNAKDMERARAEITHRVNLVAWERKVRSLVQAAFRPLSIEK